MQNHIVREETCFECKQTLVVMEFEAYNHECYIPVTIVNGLVINKAVVCHKCFNTGDYQFTDRGWQKDVQSNWGNIRRAIYLMRDVQTTVHDADGWHYLKDAQEYLWKQSPEVL